MFTQKNVQINERFAKKNIKLNLSEIHCCVLILQCMFCIQTQQLVI
jgi:hypothetical protein